MKRKILIMFLVVSSIICISKINVHADDSRMFYFDNWIPDIFIRKQYSDHATNQQARFTRRKTDGMPVYCIESGPLVYDDEIYDSYTENFEGVTGYSKDQIEKVKLIAYYGYGYENHNEEKWYAITQVLIWKTLYPDVDIYYTDTFKGNRIEKFVEEEREILDIVETHLLEPDFGEIKDLTEGDEITITDINNSLDNYEMSTSDNIFVERSKNSLIIKADKVGTAKITFSKKTNRFNYVPVIYINNKSQNLFMTGDYTPVEKNIEFKIVEKPKEEEPPVEEETITVEVPNTYQDISSSIYISSLACILLGNIMLYVKGKNK